MNADTPRGYLNGGIGMSNEKACPHCCERKKKRTPEEQKDLLKRL